MIAKTNDTENAAPARGIARATLQLLSGKTIAGLVSVGYIAIAARTLGVEGYGTLNLVHAYATIASGTIAFSGYHGMVRYGAVALARRSRSEFFGLARLFAVLELSVAALTILLAALLAPTVGRALAWSDDAIRLGPTYCLAILATVRTTPHGILQLAGRFDLIGIHQAIMPLARLVGTVVVAQHRGDLESFLWVWLGSSLAEGLSMWGLAARVLGSFDLDRGHWESLAYVRARHPGLAAFALLNNLDLTLRDFAPRATPLLVGAILGPAAAGIFALANRITTVLLLPSQMVAQAVFPVVSRHLAARDARSADIAVRQTSVVATFVGLALAAPLTAFAPFVLALVGGPGFVGGATVLSLMTVGRAIAVSAPTISAGLVATGRPRASIVANFASSIALLPVLPPMLYAWGVEGAGVHVVVQGVVVVGILIASHRGASTSEVRT